jgi:hypothetical protein
MSTSKHFTEFIKNEIQLGKGLLDIREKIVFFKENNQISQDEMRDSLNKMINPKTEEMILDLLDFVEGYCSQRFNIFKKID